MSLINDEHIIFCFEDCRVLVEFSSRELGSSEVLHRCKIYVMLTRVLPGNFFQNFKRFSHFTGAIGVPVKEFEYLMKVFEPSLIDHRTMSKNHCAMVAAFLYDLQGREGLAKSHLGIPEHGFPARLEFPDRLFYCLFLFRTEFDFIIYWSDFIGTDGEASFLDRLDCCQSSIYTTFKPFTTLILMRKVVALDSGPEEHFVNCLVIEGGEHTAMYSHCKFSMPEGIVNAGCLCILVYSLACSCIEFFAVWRKGKVCSLIQCRFSNLYASAVCFIRNGEDVNEFGFKGGIVLHRPTSL